MARYALVADRRRGRNQTVSIVVAEDKQFVLPDGAADAGPEFVLMIGRQDRREEAPGVEIGVPEVFVNASVELVAARLQNVIRHALPFVHGLGAGRLHLKLLHGLHRNPECQIARVALGSGAGQRQTLDVDLVLVGLPTVKRSHRWTSRLRAVGGDTHSEAGGWSIYGIF